MDIHRLRRFSQIAWITQRRKGKGIWVVRGSLIPGHSWMMMGSSRRVPVNRSSNAYDAVGCLVCGLLILAAFEAGYDGRWLIDRSWSPAAIGVCGMLSLGLGRIVSAASRLVIDDWFIGACLPRPEFYLLSPEKCLRRGWKS